MSGKNQSASAQVINAGIGDIEKIRDILFGKYVEVFEQKIIDLEEKISQDFHNITEKAQKNFTKIEEKMQASLEKLDQQIAVENELRLQNLSELNQQIDAAQVHLEGNLRNLEEKAHVDLKTLKDVIDENRHTIIKQVAKQKVQLENSKVSRETLAVLLDGLASKIRSDEA